MKILYAVDYYQPQLGYSEYFIPRELQAMGHEVWILTSNYYFPFPKYEETSGRLLGSREQLAGRFEENGIKIIKMPMRFEIFTRAIFDGHQEILEEFHPDFVLVNKIPGYNAVRFAQLKKKYGYKLVAYDAHLPSGFFAEGNLFLKEVFYGLFRLLIAPILIKNVDAFVAVQEETEEIIRKYYGIQEKILHIPLGTDTRMFKFSQAGRTKMRKQYGLEKDDIVLIYTGKIIQEKGVHLLFEAANIFIKKNPHVKILLVGSGNESYIAECKSILKPEYHANIIWAGFQDNKLLPNFYSAADLGVWPLQESTAMNDAAACNLPFIANDKIGARVRLTNNNARLYKQGNSRDLAKVILKMIADPTEMKEMGKRGRELMEKKLSWKKIVETYLAL